MRPAPFNVVSLRPDCDHCPTVTIDDNGQIRIGEEPHTLTLSPPEWNELVITVRNGTLREVTHSR